MSELDEQGCEERRFLLAEQNRLFFKQEAILHQKSRQKWVKQGDLSTRFLEEEQECDKWTFRQWSVV